MASISALLCLASLVTFAVVLKGGKYEREKGWPFVTFLLSLVSTTQFVVISIVVCLLSIIIHHSY